MKKVILACLLSALALFALTGCGDSETDVAASSTSSGAVIDDSTGASDSTEVSPSEWEDVDEFVVRFQALMEEEGWVLDDSLQGDSTSFHYLKDGVGNFSLQIEGSDFDARASLERSQEWTLAGLDFEVTAHESGQIDSWYWDWFVSISAEGARTYSVGIFDNRGITVTGLSFEEDREAIDSILQKLGYDF